MTPTQFLEHAIAGGWRAANEPKMDKVLHKTHVMCWWTEKGQADARKKQCWPFETILLDFSAWEAASRAVGWDAAYFESRATKNDLALFKPDESWKREMVHFVMDLANGMTIEESLAGL